MRPLCRGAVNHASRYSVEGQQLPDIDEVHSAAVAADRVTEDIERVASLPELPNGANPMRRVKRDSSAIEEEQVMLACGDTSAQKPVVMKTQHNE